MVNSKHTAPHVTLHDEVEVTNLWDNRKKFKEVAAANGTKLTFLPYVVKALTATVKKFPILNASIDDAKQEIVYKKLLQYRYCYGYGSWVICTKCQRCRPQRNVCYR
ncbi:2-oxo acid dehydrogenase subunit E2 [Enterococcus gallinarum]|nr:2-oxo acid dehydrogenase subunit E2 [Enterococcus gallinarum]